MSLTVARSLLLLTALCGGGLLLAGCAGPPYHLENLVVPQPGASALEALLRAHPGWRIGRLSDVSEPAALAYIAAHADYHPFLTRRDLTYDRRPDLIVALRDTTRPDGSYSLFALVSTRRGFRPPQQLLESVSGPAVLLPNPVRISFGPWGTDRWGFWWYGEGQGFSIFEPASIGG